MKIPFELSEKAEFDAVGFGTNAVDYLIRVNAFPAFDSKVELSEYDVAPGGEIASSMLGLSRLGYRTSYAGRFGDDEAGHIGRTSLEEASVDLSFAETMEAARTQVAFIIIDEGTGERTVIWKRDRRLSYLPNEAPVDLARKARILHMTGHDTAACIKMAEAARSSLAVVSLDLDNTFEGLSELLPLVDVCIMSAGLPQRLTPVQTERDALATMASRFGCAILGVTLGAEGSLILCGGEFFETRGFQVPGGCVDTTGAGDAFRTGFLHGLLSGDDVENCARKANAVAALKCRGRGARGALPTAAELEEMLRS